LTQHQQVGVRCSTSRAAAISSPETTSRTAFMASFFFGLLVLCASTLMYEVTLTRLLSVISWYYLAFVSVSLAMFGMTAGALLGFCFPVGMRWMKALSHERNLPWMWALNGAAGILGSFLVILTSMDTCIETCVLAGATCYLLGGLLMPAGAAGNPSWSEPVLSTS
jgi:hypothetical protein